MSITRLSNFIFKRYFNGKFSKLLFLNFSNEMYIIVFRNRHQHRLFVSSFQRRNGTIHSGRQYTGSGRISTRSVLQLVLGRSGPSTVGQKQYGHKCCTIQVNEIDNNEIPFGWKNVTVIIVLERGFKCKLHIFFLQHCVLGTKCVSYTEDKITLLYCTCLTIFICMPFRCSQGIFFMFVYYTGFSQTLIEK